MMKKHWRVGVVGVVALVAGFCMRHTMPTASLAAEEPTKKSEQPVAAVKETPASKETSGKEKEEPKKGKAKFEDVQAFSYASGLTGLFDRNSGKLYLYDTNLSACVAIRQLNHLGDAMRPIK